MRFLPTAAAVGFGLSTVAVFGGWAARVDTLAGPTLALFVAGGVTALGIVAASAFVVAREVRFHFGKPPAGGPETDYDDRSTHS